MIANIKNRMTAIQGDITTLQVDAIVNAANKTLLGGGGVYGAIHRAAGPDLLRECKTLGGCKTGEAKITKGHNLPTKFIIHTLGPIYNNGKPKEAKQLASCYRNSLELAAQHGARTIAFPAISCGVYGYPLKDACHIAVREVTNFLKNDSTIKQVLFACFDKNMLDVYKKEMSGCFDKVTSTLPGKVLTVRDKLIGGMLGLVVGDALGVPVEFVDRIALDEDPVTDMIGFGTHNQPPGTWSDDSSMALVTANSLLSGYNPTDIMNGFLRWFVNAEWTPRGRVFDYGHATAQALGEYEQADDKQRVKTFENKNDWGGQDEYSNGNGSLMRILPLSLYIHRLDPELIIERSEEVSGLTHAHPRSKLCCGYFSLLIKAILEGQDLANAMCFASRAIDPHTPSSEQSILHDILASSVLDRGKDEINSSGYVVHTLEAALWCCAKHNDFSASVLAAVNLGGDTDTTGAVAGGLAGTLYGLQAIPKEWIDAIARHDEILELAEKLADQILKDCLKQHYLHRRRWAK